MSPMCRRLPYGPVAVAGPPLTQSNPNLSAQHHSGSSDVGSPLCYGSARRYNLSQGATLSQDNVSSTSPGKYQTVWREGVRLQTHTVHTYTHTARDRTEQNIILLYSILLFYVILNGPGQNDHIRLTYTQVTR